MATDIDRQIDAVRREIRMRERVYPNLVLNKRMTQEKADQELANMRAVLHTLLGVHKFGLATPPAQSTASAA